MPLPPAAPLDAADAPQRPPRPRWWPVAGVAAAVVLAAAGALPGGPAHAQPRPAPQVALTSPTDGGYVMSVCAVRLTADASTRVGRIQRVEFYVNDQLVGTDPSAPYGIEVPPTHPALRPGGGSMPRHTAFARVVTAFPTATADSAKVTFTQAPPPPALMVVACPSQVQVPEGGSTTMAFVTVCADTPGLTLTVTGDPRIRVTPMASPPGDREHRITVLAAPGSAGATARVSASADSGGCMPGSAAVTVVPTAGA